VEVGVTNTLIQLQCQEILEVGVTNTLIQLQCQEILISCKTG